MGDTHLRHPPYYAGRPAGGSASVAHSPVVYQPGAAQSPMFDPVASAALAELLERMTAWLDHEAGTVRLSDAGTGHATDGPADPARLVPADVHFGCVPPSGAFGDECEFDGDTALGREGTTLRLAVGRGSPEWEASMRDAMARQGVDGVLVVTLEVGQYPVRQKGWRGTKEVELGTGHTVRPPWLTSLETPVQVLQFTGAVIGPDGRAVRIGAEGLAARVTGLTASALGAQALITDAEIRTLLTARREDLPGAPFVWEEGLRALARGLLGGPATR